MSIENPNFLNKKYDLHKSPEVESAADRTEKRSRLRRASIYAKASADKSAGQAGEKVSQSVKAGELI